MDKMQIYNRLPIWAQNFACYMEGQKILKSRYGSGFWEKLHEYEDRKHWTYSQKCDYRNKKLQAIVQHAYKTVPYYRNLFNEGGINPDKIKTFDDLKVLPILTKNQVKDNIDKIKSDIFKSKDVIICSTGGTTGAGLRFCSNAEEIEEQWAVWWRYRRNNGINFDTLCGNFGGKQVVPLVQSKPPFWRYNKPNHQIYFSSYHITENNAKYYADFIVKAEINWLHGYASSISELATYLCDKGIQVPLKWVSLGSENIYPHQRVKIREAFGTEPIQHYGLTEGVANISELEKGIMTVDEDFACVEFFPTSIPNEYKIIGTALTKYVMPLIRYDTGDIAIIKRPDQHNQNGRIIDGISGRSAEYVMLPSGGKVGAAAISLAIHDFHFIREMQIIQKELNRIKICIIRNLSADDFNEEKLKYSLQERFGSDMQIEIDYVDSLIKSKNGKHRLVISELH